MSGAAETTNSVPTVTCDPKAIADWLTEGARSAGQPQQVLAELCDRLVACGIPLRRVAVFVRTLHPHVMGRRIIWRLGAEIQISEAPFELLETTDFRDSTVAHVYLTASAIRRKLADPDCAFDFPVLTELPADGVTDYLAMPLCSRTVPYMSRPGRR